MDDITSKQMSVDGDEAVLSVTCDNVHLHTTAPTDRTGGRSLLRSSGTEPLGDVREVPVALDNSSTAGPSSRNLADIGSECSDNRPEETPEVAVAANGETSASSSGLTLEGVGSRSTWTDEDDKKLLEVCKGFAKGGKVQWKANQNQVMKAWKKLQLESKVAAIGRTELCLRKRYALVSKKQPLQPLLASTSADVDDKTISNSALLNLCDILVHANGSTDWASVEAELRVRIANDEPSTPVTGKALQMRVGRLRKSTIPVERQVVSIPGWEKMIDRQVADKKHGRYWSVFDDHVLVRLVQGFSNDEEQPDWDSIKMEWSSTGRPRDETPENMTRETTALKERFAFLSRTYYRPYGDSVAPGHELGSALNEPMEVELGVTTLADVPLHTVANEALSALVAEAARPALPGEVKLYGTDGSGKRIVVARHEFIGFMAGEIQRHRHSRSRPPLRKLGKVPPEFLLWADVFIAESLPESRSGEYKFISELNLLVYAAASSVSHFLSVALKGRRDKLAQRKGDLVATRRKLIQEICWLDQEVARRSAGRPPTVKQLANVRLLQLAYRNQCKDTRHMFALAHHLRKRLAVLQASIRKDEEEAERKCQRSMPLSLVLQDSVHSEAPIDQVYDYWKRIIGTESVFRKSEAMDNWSKLKRNEKVVGSQVDNQEKWNEACRKAKPWKAPGPDRIHGYWWLKLAEANRRLYAYTFSALNGRSKFPSWFTQGRAILLHKGGESKEPGDFRTICCLNTCYKLATGLLTCWMTKWVEGVIPTEQVALRKGVWGCTHAHLIDSSICQSAVVDKRDLSTAWVDFSKAFDSVSHAYIRWLLKQLGIPEAIRLAMARLMRRWSIRFETRTNGGKVNRSNWVAVKSGVLQGDTLSPLLFCLATTPLTDIIKSISTPMSWVQENVSLVAYVDDIKLYAPGKESLRTMLVCLEKQANAVGLRLNKKKCAQLHIVGGNLSSSENVPAEIPLIQENGGYKYLGIEQHFETISAKLWSRTKHEIEEKLHAIGNSQLTFRQAITAINTTIMAKLRFVYMHELTSGGRLSSRKVQAQKMDVAIRQILARHKLRFAHSCVARLYAPASAGGVGLKSCEATFEDSIVYTYAYLSLRADMHSTFERFSALEKHGRNVLRDFDGIMNAHELDVRLVEEADGSFGSKTKCIKIADASYDRPIAAARAIVSMLEASRRATWLTLWGATKGKKKLDAASGLDWNTSFLWLRKGNLSKQSARNAIAIQDGVGLTVRALPGEKRAIESPSQWCRLKCFEQTGVPAAQRMETLPHILTICPHWRNSQMVSRHNDVARAVDFELRKWNGFQSIHWRDRVPLVSERPNDQSVLYWDQRITTSKPQKHNRPDIFFWDVTAKRAWMIEIGISWALNAENGLTRQEHRKFDKYAVNSGLDESEMGRFPSGDNLLTAWESDNLGNKAIVIPLVMGCTGEVSNRFGEWLSQLPIPSSALSGLTERMQRAAVLGSHKLVSAHLGL